MSLFCLIVCARSIATEHSQGSVIQKEEADEAVLLGEYWSEGSGPAESLNEYIASVTDQSSPDYIPVEKRIAVRARPTWFWLMTRTEAAKEKRASYEKQGIGVISMKDDFKTIYGEGVQKAEP